MEFYFPSQIEDLEQVPKDNRFHVESKVEAAFMGPDDVQAKLDEISESLSNQADAIREHSNFDPLYSYVCRFSDLTPECKFSILALVTKNFSTLLQFSSGHVKARSSALDKKEWADQTKSLRNGVKMFIFLLTTLLTNSEKAVIAEATLKTKTKRGEKKAETKTKKKKNVQREWNWDDGKEWVAGSLADALENDSFSQLWPASVTEEEVGAACLQASCILLENAANLKSKSTKDCIFKLFCVSVKKFSIFGRASSCLMHLLHNFEHLSTHLAELLQYCAVEYQCPLVLTHVLREIGRMDTALLAKEGTGAKSIAAFLPAIGERLPELVLQNLSVLLSHLNSEPYHIRNGVVQLLGALVVGGFNGNEPKQAQLVESRLEPAENDKENAGDAANINKDEDEEQRSEYEESDEDSDNGRKRAPKKKRKSTGETKIQLNERTKTRDELFAVLKERCLDGVAFTRSKLLQTFIQLAESKSIPMIHMVDLAAMATGRVSDKVSKVRKYAIALLIAMMENNPWSGDLSLDTAKAKFEAIALEFKANAESKSVGQDILNEQKATMDSAFSAMTFIEIVEACAPDVSNLLQSKTSTDVLESIRFFVVAHEFQVNVKDGLMKMLVQIWNKEQQIKDAVIESYRRLYIGDDIFKTKHGDARQELANVIGANLIKLMSGASVADLTSIEELMTKLMLNDHVPQELVDSLVLIFGSKSPKVSTADRMGALQLLTMFANAQPSIISDNLALVVAKGLGPLAKENRSLARTACIALQKVTSGTNGGLTDEMKQKLGAQVLETVYKKLIAVVIEPVPLASKGGRDWYAAAEQAVNTIFALHSYPEEVASGIAARMARQIFGDVFPRPADSPLFASDAVCEATSGDSIVKIGNAEDFARLLFVLGHIAIKLLVQLEESEKTLKRIKNKSAPGKEMKDSKADEKPKKSARPKARAAKRAKDDEDSEVESKPPREDSDQEESEEKVPSKSANPSSKSGKKQKLSSKPVSTGAERSAIEEELAIGASEDYEMELLREAAERQLLARQSLLGSFCPLLVTIVSNPSKYRHKMLQSSAVLALAKFMCLSPTVCEQHLRLMFTILNRSKDANIRANVIIALGDLAFRFPNLLEPWSQHMYNRLKDHDNSVRKHTLMVLIHLILNDMLKAKGPIIEIAKCLEDKDPRIADLCKLFFHELAAKGKNPVYNILPDVISRLSNDETVTPEQFKMILKFMLGFISKDKQVESLVEKLCHRFTAVVVDSVDLDDGRSPLIEEVGVQLDVDVGPSGKVTVSLNVTDSTALKSEENVKRAPKLLEGIEDEPQSKHLSLSERKEKEAAAMLRQCRDVAYCLSQLSFTPGSVKKLIEMAKCYQNKLGDEQVFDCFTAIVSKSRKFAKADMKESLDGFETMLQELRSKQLDDQQTNRKANKARRKKDGDEMETEEELKLEEPVAKPKKTRGKGKAEAKKAPAKSKPKPRRKKDDSDDEDLPSEDEEPKSKRKPATKKAASKPAAKRRAAKKRKDESEEEPEVPSDISDVED